MPNKKSNLVSTATTLEKQIKALNIPELKTVFDVAGESQAQFIEQVVKTNGSEEIANQLYRQAKVEANNQYAWNRAQQLRLDPVLQGIIKLNPLDEVTPLRASTSKLTDNAIPERADKYAAPSSIQSMFSPGRYLCELYQVAQELHSTDNALHIDKRRPDLQTLVLSDEAAQQEVSTLDILLKTLERKVTIDDLAATSGKYDDGSFTLPYDDKLTIINAELESKQTSLRNIAILLAYDNQPVKLTPALVQEQLGLNPASYDLLTAESSLTDNKRLAHAVKLTVSQLNKLIADIQANSQSTNEQILTVLSEYVRLNHQYGLSVDQFSAIISKIKDNATDEIIPQLFGLSFSQMEMLFVLSDKPELMAKIVLGDISTILSAISELENIVQWIREQKLDFAAFNAMLTKLYSATATPELFNFLSNIYHSVDNQADAELSKQSLCRSLAAGFHLKTEIVTGLVSWLISNDAEFSLDKFNLAITEVFSDNPTLEKLEHHPLLLTQCQQLSQYVLIAQWAELTPQDIDLLLQPQLVTSSEKPLCPSLSLLRLLADFKAWQQQVKVPISEALRYFFLFSTYTHIDKLIEEKGNLEKELTEENEKLAPVDKQRKEISNKIELEKKSLNDLTVKIKSIESSITILNDALEKITTLSNEESNSLFGSSIWNNNEDNKYKKEIYSNDRDNLTSELKVKTTEKKKKIAELQSLNDLLNLIDLDKTKEDKKIREIQLKIKNNQKSINELAPSEESMLVKIHGWDQQKTIDMIENIFPDKYPVEFITVNKLCKHINMVEQLKITNEELFTLKRRALEPDNSKIK